MVNLQMPRFMCACLMMAIVQLWLIIFFLHFLRVHKNIILAFLMVYKTKSIKGPQKSLKKYLNWNQLINYVSYRLTSCTKKNTFICIKQAARERKKRRRHHHQILIIISYLFASGCDVSLWTLYRAHLLQFQTANQSKATQLRLLFDP